MLGSVAMAGVHGGVGQCVLRAARPRRALATAWSWCRRRGGTTSPRRPESAPRVVRPRGTGALLPDFDNQAGKRALRTTGEPVRPVPPRSLLPELIIKGRAAWAMAESS